MKFLHLLAIIHFIIASSLFSWDGKVFAVKGKEVTVIGDGSARLRMGQKIYFYKGDSVKAEGTVRMALHTQAKVTLTSGSAIKGYIAKDTNPAAPSSDSPPAEDFMYVKNFLGMEFVLIQSGEFDMGCSNSPELDPNCNESEKPNHHVKLTKDFYMSKYEVTQKQWKKIMGTNPSYFTRCGEDCPVETVSWHEVKRFIELLNQSEGSPKNKNENLLQGVVYRLPTEAEWEYAARAGNGTRYYWGETINSNYLWYEANTLKLQPVGKKKPNAFGIYDILGNVWEWCEDDYSDTFYSDSKKTDPVNLTNSNSKSYRGGSWNSYAPYTRVTYRSTYDPTYKNNDVGFRVIAEIKK